jgi:hypothetical protein
MLPDATQLCAVQHDDYDLFIVISEVAFTNRGQPARSMLRRMYMTYRHLT